MNDKTTTGVRIQIQLALISAPIALLRDADVNLAERNHAGRPEKQTIKAIK